MKNAHEVLREKEAQLNVVSREVEALRIVAPLLVDEAEIPPKMPPQSEYATSNSVDQGTGSAVKKRVKFWPY